MTTRVRFAIWATFAGIVAVLLTGLVAVSATQRSFEQFIDVPLLASAERVADATDAVEACRRTDSADGRVISVLVADVERCRSSATAPSPRALGAGAVDQGGADLRTTRVGGDRWRVATSVEATSFVVVVAESVEERLAATRDAVEAIVLAMLAGIVLAAGAGLVAAEPATRRIERFVARVRAAGSDHVGDMRIGQVGSRDLDAAAATVDAMLDELRTADEGRRRLFADAAHEMRTPITSIRTNAQLLERSSTLDGELRDIATRIARQSASVASLVASLVDHAAVGAWAARERTEQPLGELAAAAVRRAHARWPDAKIDAGGDHSTVSSDAELVIRAIGNLIDNAVVHGDGVVRVRWSAGALRVSDAGGGFDPAVRARAFEPFAHGARGGSGLGLAFVEHVARAHGGRVELVPDDPTAVELVFPDETRGIAG